jgi:carboxyl-terminal processing protease
MTFRRRPHLPTLAVALTLLFLHACDASGQSGAIDTKHTPAPNLGLMQEVMKLVESKYVAPVTDDQLVGNALKGMLSGLDPHSEYMDEKAFQTLRNDTRGAFAGVGIQLNMTNGIPTVIAPIEDTPAAAAGVLPGDRIVKIDGQATAGMGLEEVVDRVRGRDGTAVKLQLLRASQPPFDVSLMRQVVRITSVKSQLHNNALGYIRISQFIETTSDEFRRAIAQLKQQAHGRLAGLVLDLRNDPGGLLDAAVDVSSDLVSGGVVVSTRGRSEDDNHVYNAEAGGDLLPGVPMVVLINGASASASEIVAGALQDHKRATIMGNRSFGKGSVQTIIPLAGHGALRLTTARYYTPAGRSIQDNGILPDVVVGLPKDKQVPNALVIHESDLPRALENTGNLNTTSPPPVAPAAETEGADAAPITPELIGTPKDDQLTAALRYLQRSAAKPPGPSRG